LDGDSIHEGENWIRALKQQGLTRQIIVQRFLRELDIIHREPDRPRAELHSRDDGSRVEDPSIRDEPGERPSPDEGEVLDERPGSTDDLRGGEASIESDRTETDEEPAEESDRMEIETVQRGEFPLGSKRTAQESGEEEAKQTDVRYSLRHGPSF
jgi:hypothetical protein